MTDKKITEVLAMSNSALGRWANKKAPAPVPIGDKEVLGYCRYSTYGQHETTIEKQQEFITAAARQRGMRDPRFFNDRAARGVTDDRAAWKALMRHVRHGTVVMVHEITRFARETFVSLKMIRQVQQAGGTVELVNVETKDTIILTIMSAMSEYDYRSVVTRLRDGRVQAVANGSPYRRPPYGYDKVGKDFVINEEEARWVREIFRMRVDGASYSQISRYLTEENAPLRKGGFWNPLRVERMLHNPLYAGYLVMKRPVFSWESAS